MLRALALILLPLLVAACGTTPAAPSPLLGFANGVLSLEGKPLTFDSRPEQVELIVRLDAIRASGAGVPPDCTALSDETTATLNGGAAVKVKSQTLAANEGCEATFDFREQATAALKTAEKVTVVLARL